MNITIRHRVSDLEEEVYSFEIFNNCISYKGILFSNRSDSEDIFGYDWEDHYYKQKQIEESNLFREYDIDEEDYYYNTFSLYEVDHKLCKINNKYDPVFNKTKQGKTYLYGVSSSSVAKDHPLKISESEVIEAAINHLKGLKVK